MARCRADFTIPLRYIEPSIAVTHREISRIRDENLQVLLERKKLQLVLDLDHTLVHATRADALGDEEKEMIMSEDDVYEIMGGDIIVKLRPGIREFLKEVGSMFEVSIYTMGVREYAKAVHELLVSKVGFPRDSWVIAREDCVVDQQKRLNIVLSHERVVLIVDDKPKVWGECSGKDNVVEINRYDFFMKHSNGVNRVIDKELARVLDILKRVHASFYKEDAHVDLDRKDARKILKSVMLSKLKLVIKVGGKRLRPADNDISERCQKAISV